MAYIDPSKKSDKPMWEPPEEVTPADIDFALQQLDATLEAITNGKDPKDVVDPGFYNYILGRHGSGTDDDEDFDGFDPMEVCGTFDTLGSVLRHAAIEGMDVPHFAPETKTVLQEWDGDMIAWFRDECDPEQMDFAFLFPAIKDITVDDDSSISIAFADGTEVSATAQGDDKFSIEYGITICLFKRILMTGTNSEGGSLFNKLVDHAVKFYETKLKNAEKAEADAKDLAERIAAKRAKRQAKAEAKEAEEREREIEIHKEAYLRAMRELRGNQ